MTLILFALFQGIYIFVDDNTRTLHNVQYVLYTVRKEMKCIRDSEILYGMVHDSTRISSCFSDFRVVSWTNSCRISELPLQFISFLTVCNLTWITPPCLKGEGGGCDKRPVYRFCIESSFVPSWRYTSVSQSVFHYSIAEYRHNRILKI